MIKYISFIIFLYIAWSCAAPEEDFVQDNFTFAEYQIQQMIEEIRFIPTETTDGSKPKLFPRSIGKEGDLNLTDSGSWTSGFFPGLLWYLYEYTGNMFWRDKAEYYTGLLHDEQYNTGTHDVGFMINDSYGNALRLTGKKSYESAIVNAANSLATRFNPSVGATRSWNPRGEWLFPVIIDNMMNLELLFNATAITGDSSYYRMAVSHADRTMENHFRADYSSYHVIDYHPQTGSVLHKHTHQGYGHETAWARGQAWALYGFASMYRHTGDKKYIDLAEKIAGMIFSHRNMPDDLVPYWDLDAPGIPDEPRDVSSATIIASALYDLSASLDPNGRQYKELADRILGSAARNYRAEPGTHHGFLLLSSTGNKNRDDEVGVPIIYADFYFLQALLRKKNIETNNQ